MRNMMSEGEAFELLISYLRKSIRNGSFTRLNVYG